MRDLVGGRHSLLKWSACGETESEVRAPLSYVQGYHFRRRDFFSLRQSKVLLHTEYK